MHVPLPRRARAQRPSHLIRWRPAPNFVGNVVDSFSCFSHLRPAGRGYGAAGPPSPSRPFSPSRFSAFCFSLSAFPFRLAALSAADLVGGWEIRRNFLGDLPGGGPFSAALQSCGETDAAY